MISIVIACIRLDDRKAVITLLNEQDDFQITGIAEDDFDVISLAITKQPDVIIMDFNLKSGIESPSLAPIVKRNSPSTSLIVLYSPEERICVERSLKVGISGYLNRQGGFDNLVSSVWSVYYGGLYIELDEEINCFAVYAVNRKKKEQTLPAFSPTELGIFSGITLGHTDMEIASSLNISIGTLRNYVNNVKKKTGLRNRTQIAIYALQYGMIQLGGRWEQLAVASNFLNVNRNSKTAGLQPYNEYHAPLRHGASSL